MTEVAEPVDKEVLPEATSPPELPDFPATSLTDPDGSYTSPPPVEVAAKILKVQAKLKALIPAGKMFIQGNEISYISKHQIVNSVIPLMAEAGLVCVFGGVHHIDTLDRKVVFMGSPRREYTFIKERLWAVYHLVDVESGKKYSQMVPADVSGMDAKNATVGLAFAERDFLSQIFLIRAQDDSTSVEDVSMTDYSPMSVARNLNMEDLKETLEIKANAAIARVTRKKVDEEARMRGVTIKPATGEMDTKELLEVIDICMELMDPSTAREHLASVGKEVS